LTADLAPRRITFLVPNLAGSPLGRALPLAAALARDMPVDIVGICAPGRAVQPVYAGELPVTAVPGRPLNPRAIARVAALVHGDVIVACKPLPETLLAALLAARRRGCAVVLDVDDDEWSESGVAAGGLAGWLKRRADARSLATRLIHPLTRRVDATTVSTSALRQRYGGTIIRHGPDERVFDPVN
jgi:hypothetical protein